ncbi:cell division protein ZapB [Thermodesulfobacteriota bacterium]
MDNEIILRQFEEIEQKVEKIINTCKALEATNLELKNKTERLEGELQDKVEAEKSYAEEKVLIRSKVDGLLSRLEEISGN